MRHSPISMHSDDKLDLRFDAGVGYVCIEIMDGDGRSRYGAAPIQLFLPIEAADRYRAAVNAFRAALAKARADEACIAEAVE